MHEVVFCLITKQSQSVLGTDSMTQSDFSLSALEVSLNQNDED